jgi:PAS domain S-box-containing protein
MKNIVHQSAPRDLFLSRDLFLTLIKEEADINDDSSTDLSVVSDLTDRLNEPIVHRMPTEKETLMHSFFQRTTQLAWIIDEEANLLFASNSFYRHFGLEANQCKHKKITDIVPAAVSRAVYRAYKKVLETGKPVEITYQEKWTDGNDLISCINLFPLVSISGRKVIGGQALHLPDRTELEKERHQLHERLVNLNKVSSEAIWEWDMQSGQMIQNDILLKMTGYQSDQLRGLSWWLRHIHTEDRNRIADRVKEIIDKHQQSWQDEYQFRCADGSFKHIHHKGFVVYENELPVKMIGSLHDVSELKNLETELADEKLKTHKEISEAVIQAEEKERAQIGRELHDNVNQILSATTLFVGALVPHDKEQQQIKQKSIEYIQLAIDEIRKVSKALVAPQLREQGLIESIHDMIADLGLASALKIRFVHDLDSGLLSPTKKITLFRIVQEQLKNIMKHSKAVNTTIFLQSHKDNLQLVIEDDGVGFDPKQTRRGIGLSNIQERVKFYNGTVSIETAPGKGCALSVTIPIAE